MAPASPIRVERWSPNPASLGDDLEMLGGVLHACVHTGASVSFVLPFSRDDAKAFWENQVLPAVRAGSRRVLLIRSARQIVGTVQLDFAMPPNQPHRVEVKKLLVHPDARRSGIARSLMAAVEEQAREMRRSLLVLDCVTGGVAEKLYLSVGYIPVGVIPHFALNYDSTKLEGTTVMYKELAEEKSGYVYGSPRNAPFGN
jgi:GNAT superfamily N-acetyltransferase